MLFHHQSLPPPPPCNPGVPLASPLYAGGRQADVPPAPRGSEHRLHPRPRGLHARPPRVGDSLVHQTAGNPRRRRRGHTRGTAALTGIPGGGWRAAL